MMTVLGTIGSLAVVLILVVLAVLLISAVAMLTFLAMVASLTRWERVWRRLLHRAPRLELKLSGETVPERRRARLRGGTPRLRRRFPLGAAARGGEPRRGSGAFHGPRLHRRPVERHTGV
ncbi:hypothetical protein BKM31_24155 [[Actinomadura] parvosata subsp. kistnae]|uniref:Uncharacterized protein n=1 Tax=[Actinomadura] parvosata subsp. kistnae TaxID=1909395 RepID=A0A1V0A1S1_9ACTN|nr:hypothetical protein [Nonomuraea sp. ATCC 55076]AQZ64144.1 hypothetical protein BKM31_24155 [Nonomuraea sp. ATCC 55076]